MTVLAAWIQAIEAQEPHDIECPRDVTLPRIAETSPKCSLEKWRPDCTCDRPQERLAKVIMQAVDEVSRDAGWPSSDATATALTVFGGAANGVGEDKSSDELQEPRFILGAKARAARYPGPDCLDPDEVEAFAGGTALSEDQLRHVSGCDACRKLLQTLSQGASPHSNPFDL